MKKTVSLALGMLVAAAALAQSKIVTESIQSQLLGCEQKYNVYLPDGYDAGKSYPVIYLLHGLYGDYTDWVKQGNMRIVADELIGTGELRPVVIVMPNAGNADVHHYQNGYFNVENWPYEDFFFQELLPAVEQKYACGGSKGRRAIMGLSMGGGGSIAYAQRHPELFSSSYGMSAWLDNKQNEVQEGMDPDSKLILTANAVREHSALDFMDKADPATIDRLKTVQWFLDCGDDDDLMPLSVDLYRKMKKAGLRSELRVRNGAHTWEYWHTALRLSLPFASRNFTE
ncbi:MAG: alpha/beta hydrolase-fold protein [Candidatus Cryptobacteroides sp.]|nr:alpha/beta hydrolase-fold protein [Candidatus Cryptobacteroides sp.]